MAAGRIRPLRRGRPGRAPLLFGFHSSFGVDDAQPYLPGFNGRCEAGDHGPQHRPFS
jgi:hypothetical protein